MLLGSRSIVVALSLVVCCAATLSAAEGPGPRFESDVLPIFKQKCVECHNPTARKGGLDLTTPQGVVKGGESGQVFEAGKSADSLLYEMVHDGLMPPDGKKPLTEAEKKQLKTWIDSGARFADANAGRKTVTQHDVLPILLLRCTVCHGANVQQAGLDLRSKSGLLKGGKSGPAIVLGKPEESLLIKRIHAQEMPPPKKLVDAGVRPVEASELETLEEWIRTGAREAAVDGGRANGRPDPLVSDADRQHWAFRKPVRPAAPAPREANRVRNPIDAFVLKALEGKRLSLNEEAERLTLIRRVALDLTGLPPEWSDVEAFLADGSPRAYETMVDKYLASPHYGERWARYWLDLAGYADSEGKRSADPLRPDAWRYRDYVVRAFNSDKPYDRFLLEQLAGDELADYDAAERPSQELVDNIIATGFLRMAPDGTGSDIVNTAVERMEVIADEMEVLGSSVLGLTLKCAQCHTHKYDPIPQRDYFRIVAVFKGAYDEHNWLTPSSVAGQTKGVGGRRQITLKDPAELAAWEQAKQKVAAQVKKLKDDLANFQRERVATSRREALAALPEAERDAVAKLLETPATERTVEQKALAEKYEKRFTRDIEAVVAAEAPVKTKVADVDKKVKALEANAPPEPSIRALWDRGEPSPTYIYRRGQVNNPGELVEPGVLSALSDGKTPFVASPPWEGAKKTGRRLAFARWLVSPEHPLTARVMVNRVWKYHFGEGLVRTLDNFGKTGERPSHPELIDWLACEFVAQGWSLKQLHRLILTSSTYRQTSQVDDEKLRVDPENRLLSRMPLRRLDAEALYDSLLAVAGKLDRKPFGAPDAVEVRADGLVTPKAHGDGSWRRAIYVQQRRKEMPTFLETFDLPQMIPNCVERPNSLVAGQALHLWNDGQVRQLATAFAARLRSETNGDLDVAIERAFQLALSRTPRSEERVAATETVQKLTSAWQAALSEKDRDQAPLKALASFCHTLFNSAAFTFVD